MANMEKMARLQQVLMTWQGPAPQRQRFVVAKIAAHGDETSFIYINKDSDLKEARAAGFVGYPAFPDFDQLYSNGVLASLASRLPPSSRADYPDFLRHWFMNPKDNPDLLDVLAYSGGALPRDTFGFVPLFPKHGSFDFVTELAGYHHRLAEPGGRRLEKEGDALVLHREPDNPSDPDAVIAILDKQDKKPQIVGHLMRGLQTQALYWLANGRIRGNIARLNGSQNRPLAYAHLWVDF